MGLKTIKKLKKDNSVRIKTTYLKTVIAGKSPYTILLWNKIFEEKGDKDLLLITGDQLTNYDLFPWGPTPLRGDGNVEKFKKYYPEIELNENNINSKYFKDSEFKDFGGRAKSETLLFGESYYIKSGIKPDYKKIFPYLENDEFINLLNEKISTDIIIKVEKHVEETLTNDKNWIITFANGNKVECENLIWGFPICDLFDIMDSVATFDYNFIEFYKGVGKVSNLYVKFDVEGEVKDKGTVFIPLSYTHEWGHFVGEFKGNSAEFIHYLDKENITEDEVAKRIKILKRSFEKIYPDLKINNSSEYIYFASESSALMLDIDPDKLNHENLYFVGVNAPIKELDNNVTHMARALTSIVTIENSIIGE